MADANGAAAGQRDPEVDLWQLLHQLNNQLSVVLAHAELLEAKAVDGQARSRATEVVTGTVAAMATVRAIRDRFDDEPR